MMYSILFMAALLKFDVQADGGIDDCGIGMGCPGDDSGVTWDEAEDWHDIPTPPPVVPIINGKLYSVEEFWEIVGHYEAQPRCSPNARGYPEMNCIEFIKARTKWCNENLFFGDRCSEWAFHYTGECNPSHVCGSPSGRRLAGIPAPAPEVLGKNTAPSPAPEMSNDFVCNAVMQIAAGIKQKYNGGDVSSSDIREGLRQLYQTCDEMREGNNGVEWIVGTQCLLYSELSFRVNHELIHQVLAVSLDGSPEAKQMACANVVNQVNEKIRANDISGVTLKDDSVVEVNVESFTSDGEFDLEVAETWAEYSEPARRLMAAVATSSVFVIGTLCNSFQNMAPKMLEATFE